MAGPYFRCGMGKSAGGYTQADIDSYYIEIDSVKHLPTVNAVREYGYNNQTFNSPINVGNNVAEAGYLAYMCTNFNSAINIGSNVKNCSGLCWKANIFNYPVVFPESVVDMSNAFRDTVYNQPVQNIHDNVNIGYMFSNDPAFDQPLNIGNNVNAYSTLNNCNNFNQPLNIGDNCYLFYTVANCFNFNKPISIGVNCDCQNTLQKTSYNLPFQNIIDPKNLKGFFSYTPYNYPINVICTDDRNLDCGELIREVETFNSPVMIMMNGGELILNSFASNVMNYNKPLTIQNASAIRNCAFAFRGTNFNQPIDLGILSGDCMSAFSNDIEFNQPLYIGTNITSENTINASNILKNAKSFNSDIVFSERVTLMLMALDGCTNFGGNIYVKGKTYRSLNIQKMLFNTNNSLRKNVFFNAALNNVFNVTSSSSLVSSVSWTAMTNGFYNAAWNIYCYYNYEG
mgnify:CR=1 FL=1